MQPRFMVASQRKNNSWKLEKKKVVIWMVLQCMPVYITNILPMYIQNNVNLKVDIFHEELLILIQERCFCLLFYSM